MNSANDRLSPSKNKSPVSSTGQPLRLDDASSLPDHFVARLRELDSIFLANTYVDSIAADPRVRPLVTELEEHLRVQPVRGYHCTREPCPGHFAREGLRLTDVEAHQREFLQNFGHLFTASELQDMQKAWTNYFVGEHQVRGRNGRLWFCLTEKTARSDGTQVFFEHFGGEAIFMPLKRHPTIAAKLGTIGTPVIVEVRLVPEAPSRHRSLALPLLSAYHRTRRADANSGEAETYIERPLAACDVLSVTAV
ncbi:MAG: hypothetical protein Q8S12_10300 [Hydrogenophaga sp.]|uniref:hypothetical protein n=1 Tax=Hydrogenophaga sp. TaxID=1904254 RepID=UPI00273443FD|nr:hypothetical protein [Hydrogenophaga sp.]MDP3626980.1 hypothetical protein [Hydrogenophaga sp.]